MYLFVNDGISGFCYFLDHAKLSWMDNLIYVRDTIVRDESDGLKHVITSIMSSH